MSRYKTLFPILALFSLRLHAVKNQHVNETYENGNLRSAGFLKDSLLNGLWKFYYPSGS